MIRWALGLLGLGMMLTGLLSPMLSPQLEAMFDAHKYPYTMFSVWLVALGAVLISLAIHRKSLGDSP